MAYPTLPTATFDVTMPVLTGSTIHVTTASAFQAVLDSCVPGQTITLDHTATFSGHFQLKAKTGYGAPGSGTDWIIIRTDAPDSSLPPPGTRIGPSYAGVMPKVILSDTADLYGAIYTVNDENCRNYRFIGVEFGFATGLSPLAIIFFHVPQAAVTSLTQICRNMILDRCYIHGTPTADGTKQGVALHCRGGAIIDSYIAEIHRTADGDTQAIHMQDGPGPYLIQNNFLSSAGENIMSGGGGPSIAGVIPSDVTFRRNHVFKPLSWCLDEPSYGGITWAVKNSFEIKCGQRWLIEGNIFENMWAHAQQGSMLAITMRKELSTNHVWDITVRYNEMVHMGGGVTLLGRDTVGQPIGAVQDLQRVWFHNNLWHEIDFVRFIQMSYGTGAGMFWKLVDGTIDVSIEHNTVLLAEVNKAVYDYMLYGVGVAAAANGAAMGQSGTMIRNNLMHHSGYGFVSDAGIGNAGFPTGFPGLVLDGNVNISPSGSWPNPNGIQPSHYSDYPDNFWPVNEAAVGFVDYAGGNYRLAPTSIYYHGGTDGLDPGANIDEVMRRTAGVEAGSPENTPLAVAIFVTF